MARLARAEIFDPAEIVAVTSSEKRSALATSWGSMSVPARISITENAGSKKNSSAPCSQFRNRPSGLLVYVQSLSSTAQVTA